MKAVEVSRWSTGLLYPARIVGANPGSMFTLCLPALHMPFMMKEPSFLFFESVMHHMLLCIHTLHPHFALPSFIKAHRRGASRRHPMPCE